MKSLRLSLDFPEYKPVRISYDPEHNVAYIRLKETPRRDLETIELGESINIDITPEGEVYGIELLDANRQLPEEIKEVLEDR
ncbi:MAG: DUF2283 domain-containing protein [Aquificaceae bacterium]